jgi:F0F1-type ATP synthase assembly protein I
MPSHDEPSAEAESLDRRIAAAEAAQARQASGDSHRAMAQGYRFLGEVVGGVFMGAALGWLSDRFITPEPLGLVVGLFLGAGLSITVAVRTAARAQKRDAAPAVDED